MSKGVSANQRRILGMAVSAFDQGIDAHLQDAGFPHLSFNLVMHMVYGIPIHDRSNSSRAVDAGSPLDTAHPGYASAKVATTRALRNLVERDLLRREATSYFHGYFLTVQGEAVGRQYIEPVDMDLCVEVDKTIRQFLVTGSDEPVAEKRGGTLEQYAKASFQDGRGGVSWRKEQYGNSLTYLVGRIKRRDYLAWVVYGGAIPDDEKGSGWGLRLPLSVSVSHPDNVISGNTYADEGNHA